MKKKLLILSLISVMMLLLTACGSSTKADGYYTCRPTTTTYALEIKNGKAIMYTDNYNYYYMTEGKVKKTSTGCDIIFEETEKKWNFSDYSPMHADPSEDGKKLALSSDSSQWVTDNYRAVTESEFEEIVAKIKKTRGK